MIVHAKLDRSELLPASQCLHFVSQLDNEAVKLMEVDDNLLQQLEAGHRYDGRCPITSTTRPSGRWFPLDLL